MAEDGLPSDAPEPLKEGRNKDGTFAKGFLPAGAGKVKGSRHKVTMAIEALLGGEAEGLTRRAIEVAMTGDVTALRLCLERLSPARKDSTVQFDLPKLEKPEDAIIAASAIAQAVSLGELTPLEAEALSRVVDVFVSAIGAHNLADRIASLEASRDESPQS